MKKLKELSDFGIFYIWKENFQETNEYYSAFAEALKYFRKTDLVIGNVNNKIIKCVTFGNISITSPYIIDKPFSTHIIKNLEIVHMPTNMELVQQIKKKLYTRLKWENLPYISDQIRSLYIETPQENVEVNNMDFKYSDMKPENNFTFVKETPDYFLYVERWVPSCKKAFSKKYGVFTVEKLKRIMPERLIKIGKVYNLKLVDFEYKRGIMKAVFAKKNEKTIDFEM